MKYTELKTTEEAIEFMSSGEKVESTMGDPENMEWQPVYMDSYGSIRWVNDNGALYVPIVKGRRFRLVEPEPEPEYERWELDTSYQQIRFVDPAKNGGYRTASACIDNGGVFEFEDGTVAPICTRMVLGAGHTGLLANSEKFKTETAVACRFYKR